ncbi:MAG: hypothetical protein JW910_07430 [Anaerolineae bacterium]|nr:hypothetical protein [Anaerolineae bacterium]
MGWIGGVAAASAAAAAEAERQLEEEMLGYGEDEITGEWEFKIVRSTMGAFDNRKTFARLVAAEAEAGWELLEKLDDKRVRFKRHTSARLKDYLLPDDVDPYRTAFGMGESTLVWIVLGLTLAGVIALVVGLIVASAV